MCTRTSPYAKDAVCPVCNTLSIPWDKKPSCKHIIGVWDGDHFRNISPKLSTFVLANASRDDEVYFDEYTLADSAINIHSIDEVLSAVKKTDSFVFDIYQFDDGLESFYFFYDVSTTSLST